MIFNEIKELDKRSKTILRWICHVRVDNSICFFALSTTHFSGADLNRYRYLSASMVISVEGFEGFQQREDTNARAGKN